MRKRLSTLGILTLVMIMVVVVTTGCSRQAEERETQATEPAAGTSGPRSGEVVPAPGETVVSAVTPGAQTAVPPASGTIMPAPTAGGEVPAQPEPTAAPGEATAAPPPAQPPASGGTQGSTWHTVQAGETLSSIARRYGTTWQAIAQANNLSAPYTIYVNQKLMIPTSGGSSSGSSSTSGCRVRHTVRQGEWVWQIARNYNVSPYDILAANGLTISTARTIYPGTVLCIP